jgi:hypothetical protein
MSEKHKVRNVLINIIILLALAVIIYMVASVIYNIDNDSEDTTIFGLKIIHIETDSMEPNIKTNAWVIGYKKDFNTLKPDDYISFVRESDLELVTHKISSVSEPTAYVLTESIKYNMPDGQKITEVTYRYYVPKWLVFNFVSDLYTTKGRIIYGSIAGAVILFIIIICIAVRRKKRRKATVQQIYDFRDIPELSALAKPIQAPEPRDWRDEIFDGIDL